MAAGEQGQARGAGGGLRRELVAKLAQVCGRRADERHPVGVHRLGERRVLGEEPVPGVHGVRARDVRGGDHSGQRQVGLRRLRRADADALVCELHVRRVLVGLGVHGDGADPELAAGADDAQRDLAAVGDEDFAEHGLRRSEAEQLLPELHRAAVLDQHLDDRAFYVALDLVHQLHRLDDADNLALADLKTDVR